MKRSLSVLMGLALAAMAFFASCQKHNLSTPMSQQITGKWTIKEAIGKYTSSGVTNNDTTAYTSADYMEFRTDSTLTIVANGSTYDGKWKITSNKLFITGTGYMDYSNGFDLPILTANSLQLYYTETGPGTYLEQKLNLYR